MAVPAVRPGDDSVGVGGQSGLSIGRVVPALISGRRELAPFDGGATAKGWLVGALLGLLSLAIVGWPAQANAVASLPSAPAPTQVDPNPGIAVSWGDNVSGQLGDGTNNNRSVPVEVVSSGVLAGKSVTQVSAGEYHACALADGAAYCWGYNLSGQVGDGSKVASSVPVAVSTSGDLAGKTVTSIAAGGFHTCAVADGAVYCWGLNTFGQLGDGSTAESLVPVAVDTSGVLAGKTIKEVSTGGLHTCALATDGAAACWGWNSEGQLGNATTDMSVVPVNVDTTGVLAGKTLTQLGAGGFHTCAVVSDGSASCWGLNGEGQLGNNSNVSSSVPVSVDSTGVLAGRTVSNVEAGEFQTCAVADQQAFCWGLNITGQLGDGSTLGSRVPVAVNTAGVLAGQTVMQVATGYNHTCATVGDGSVSCWGANSSGQLGNASATASLVPVSVNREGVLAGKAVGQVSVGTSFSLTVAREITAPAAPTGLLAVPGYGQAMVSFTPGADGGSPVTNYEYSLNPDDAEPTWVPFDPPLTGSPATVTGLTNGQTYSMALRAVNVVGAGPASARVTVTPLGAAFVAVDPYRAYDSRVDGGMLPGGSSRVVSTGVPADAVAVAYNLTATGTAGSGLLTVTPGGVPTGGTSTLNYTARGQTVANAFASGVDAGGQVSVSATGAATHFVVDVVGYYVPQPLEMALGTAGAPSEAEPPNAARVDAVPQASSENNIAEPSLFWPTNPTRAYDSRDVGAGGPLLGGQSRVVNVTAGGLVPPEATAVAYTLTQTGTVGGGWLAVGPAGAPQPPVSSINWFQSNQTSANSSAAEISKGSVQVWAGTSAGGSAQFVIDILGYFLPVEFAPGGAGFTAIEPQRAYDSRVDDPPGPISAGEAFTTSMAVSGVPERTAAVAFNLTATGGSGSGYLTTTPGDSMSPPVASTINWWRPNQTLANGSVVALPVTSNGASPLSTDAGGEPTASTGVNGTLPLPVTTFAGGGSTHYVIDVAGYYSPPGEPG